MSRKADSQVRYAVVGLGYIAQVAVLPAFANAQRNSRLAALVSGDPEKLEELGRRYGVEAGFSYERYEECLEQVDAVYIALPNHLHRDYAVRAAERGVHVLCEKPLAVTEEDCLAMISAAEENGVALMTAYRLHFEKTSLQAVESARSGVLGEPRIFHSVFSMQVDPGNIRLAEEDRGGGPLYDLGVYCINAARHLFGAEPIEALAVTANDGEARFAQTHEMIGCLLRFPGDGLASFVCSAGAADAGWYELLGTRGRLRLDPAYEYAEGLERELTIGDRTQRASYPKRDQFAPELLYFSECVLRGETPEPSGREGWADVRVVRALLESAESGEPVSLPPIDPVGGPTAEQEIYRPPVDKPDLVHAEAPHGEE
jgi:glucose-fructose oxidoreductase